METPRSEPSAVLDYRFRQTFRVPARAAYRWATDYAPNDWRLGGVDGLRIATHHGPSLVELVDRMGGPGEDRAPKTRMVQLYPRTLSWVSTHVRGSRLHSQFRYRIVSTGARSSALEFEGREVRWDASPLAAREAAIVRRRLRAEDRSLWRHFARAMEAELRAAPATGAGPTRSTRGSA